MSTIFIGDKELKKLYLGQNEIKKIYLGDKEIWSGGSEYPSGFRPVEYLETNGKQYIDTLFFPTSNTKIELTFKVPGWASGNFGCRQGLNTKQFMFRISNTTSPVIYCSLNAWQTPINNIRFSSEYDVVEFSKEGAFFNGVSHSETLFPGNFTSLYSLTLFALNDAGTITPSAITKRIFSCKLWDNDELFRDFQPGLDANNRPCMYDRITKQLFYNQGTGEFQYGNFI